MAPQKHEQKSDDLTMINSNANVPDVPKDVQNIDDVVSEDKRHEVPVNDGGDAIESAQQDAKMDDEQIARPPHANDDKKPESHQATTVDLTEKDDLNENKLTTDLMRVADWTSTTHREPSPTINIIKPTEEARESFSRQQSEEQSLDKPDEADQTDRTGDDNKVDDKLDKIDAKELGTTPGSTDKPTDKPIGAKDEVQEEVIVPKKDVTRTGTPVDELMLDDESGEKDLTEESPKTEKRPNLLAHSDELKLIEPKVATIAQLSASKLSEDMPIDAIERKQSVTSGETVQSTGQAPSGEPPIEDRKPSLSKLAKDDIKHEIARKASVETTSLDKQDDKRKSSIPSLAKKDDTRRQSTAASDKKAESRKSSIANEVKKDDIPTSRKSSTATSDQQDKRKPSISSLDNKDESRKSSISSSDKKDEGRKPSISSIYKKDEIRKSSISSLDKKDESRKSSISSLDKKDEVRKPSIASLDKKSDESRKPSISSIDKKDESRKSSISSIDKKDEVRKPSIASLDKKSDESRKSSISSIDKKDEVRKPSIASLDKKSDESRKSSISSIDKKDESRKSSISSLDKKNEVRKPSIASLDKKSDESRKSSISSIDKKDESRKSSISSLDKKDEVRKPSIASLDKKSDESQKSSTAGVDKKEETLTIRKPSLASLGRKDSIVEEQLSDLQDEENDSKRVSLISETDLKKRDSSFSLELSEASLSRKSSQAAVEDRKQSSASLKSEETIKVVCTESPSVASDKQTESRRASTTSVEKKDENRKASIASLHQRHSIVEELAQQKDKSDSLSVEPPTGEERIEDDNVTKVAEKVLLDTRTSLKDEQTAPEKSNEPKIPTLTTEEPTSRLSKDEPTAQPAERKLSVPEPADNRKQVIGEANKEKSNKSDDKAQIDKPRLSLKGDSSTPILDAITQELHRLSSKENAPASAPSRDDERKKSVSSPYDEETKIDSRKSSISTLDKQDDDRKSSIGGSEKKDDSRKASLTSITSLDKKDDQPTARKPSIASMRSLSRQDSIIEEPEETETNDLQDNEQAKKVDLKEKKASIGSLEKEIKHDTRKPSLVSLATSDSRPSTAVSDKKDASPPIASLDTKGDERKSSIASIKSVDKQSDLKRLSSDVEATSVDSVSSDKSDEVFTESSSSYDSSPERIKIEHKSRASEKDTSSKTFETVKVQSSDTSSAHGDDGKHDSSINAGSTDVASVEGTAVNASRKQSADDRSIRKSSVSSTTPTSDKPSNSQNVATVQEPPATPDKQANLSTASIQQSSAKLPSIEACLTERIGRKDEKSPDTSDATSKDDSSSSDNKQQLSKDQSIHKLATDLVRTVITESILASEKLSNQATSPDGRTSSEAAQQATAKVDTSLSGEKEQSKSDESKAQISPHQAPSSARRSVSSVDDLLFERNEPSSKVISNETDNKIEQPEQNVTIPTVDKQVCRPEAIVNQQTVIKASGDNVQGLTSSDFDNKSSTPLVASDLSAFEASSVSESASHEHKCPSQGDQKNAPISLTATTIEANAPQQSKDESAAAKNAKSEVLVESSMTDKPITRDKNAANSTTATTSGPVEQTKSIDSDIGKPIEALSADIKLTESKSQEVSGNLNSMKAHDDDEINVEIKNLNNNSNKCEGNSDGEQRTQTIAQQSDKSRSESKSELEQKTESAEKAGENILKKNDSERKFSLSKTDTATSASTSTTSTASPVAGSIVESGATTGDKRDAVEQSAPIVKSTDDATQRSETIYQRTFEFNQAIDPAHHNRQLTDIDVDVEISHNIADKQQLENLVKEQLSGLDIDIQLNVDQLSKDIKQQQQQDQQFTQAQSSGESLRSSSEAKPIEHRSPAVEPQPTEHTQGRAADVDSEKSNFGDGVQSASHVACQQDVVQSGESLRSSSEPKSSKSSSLDSMSIKQIEDYSKELVQKASEHVASMREDDNDDRLSSLESDTIEEESIRSDSGFKKFVNIGVERRHSHSSTAHRHKPSYDRRASESVSSFASEHQVPSTLNADKSSSRSSRNSLIGASMIGMVTMNSAILTKSSLTPENDTDIFELLNESKSDHSESKQLKEQTKSTDQHSSRQQSSSDSEYEKIDMKELQETPTEPDKIADSSHAEISAPIVKLDPLTTVPAGVQSSVTTEANTSGTTTILSTSTIEHPNLPSVSLTSSSAAQSDLNQKSAEKEVASWSKPLGLPSVECTTRKHSKTEATVAVAEPSSIVLKWKPLGRPSPLEPSIDKNVARNAKQTSKSSGAPSAANNHAQAMNNEKDQQMLTASLTSDSGAIASLKSFHFDLIYVSHHGEQAYNHLEFFKKCPTKNYVLSGSNPSRETLDALLEARKQSNAEQKKKDKQYSPPMINIIPTHESESLFYWISDQQKELEQEAIEVAPSASRCSVRLENHKDEVCSAYRIQF